VRRDRRVTCEAAALRTLVVGNSSPNSSDYVAAVAPPDGNLLVAYVPPDHWDQSPLHDCDEWPARARWFNPANAEYRLIARFDNTGPASFAQPGNNGTGFIDCVLLSEKAVA
jgi:hypothetical protein